jgi:hypothetical protein
MSYCRWSSDNWKSDVYCYESDKGFVIHVAGRKNARELKTKVDHSSIERMVETFKQQSEEIETMDYVVLDCPSAGESFCLSSLEDFMSKLIELQDEGLHVPAYVFDMITEEMTEEKEHERNKDMTGDKEESE